MNGDAGRPDAHAAGEDETGGAARRIDRRALMLGAAAAGAGLATLASGAQTADAQPVEYVKLAEESDSTVTTSIVTSGGIGMLGVQDGASGLLASTGLTAGLAGDSDAVDGVLGTSSASNGVHGISSAKGASGVLGDDTSTAGGSGVQGSSTNGIGVLASSTNGTALKVEGPAQLSGTLSAGGQITAASLTTGGAVSAASLTTTGEVSAASLSATGTASAGSLTTSGTVSAGSLSATGAVSAGSLTTSGAVSAASLATPGAVSAGSLAVTGKLELSRSGIARVAAHRKTVTVPVPGMTKDSLVIATAQGTSVKVAVACVAAQQDSFIIHMTAAPRRSMRVAWLVLN